MSIEAKKYAYSVEIESTCLDSFSNEGEQGRWEETWQNTLEGVSVGGDFPDLASSLQIPVGERCYVVWYEMSSGDSYGHARHRHASPLGIFLDLTVALEFSKAVREIKEINEIKAQTIETSDGQSHRVVPEWNGYFETLDEINIDSLIMVPDKGHYL